MITFETLDNGFETIKIENSNAVAKLSLQGAHLFHYEAKGKSPLLWLSDTSAFEIGQAIRGGVPICWPWFGAHKTNPSLPAHGFARTSLWEFIENSEIDEGTTQITMQLTHSDETLAIWPYKFNLRLIISVGETLALSLVTENLDENAFEITQALHTYFNVSSIDNASVKGLDQQHYFDALSRESKIQQGDIYFAEEVDRVYQNIRYPLTLVENEQVISIESEGSDSVIVWNPWIDKCARMSAMTEDAYKTMLCIESANALKDSRVIEPGQQHTLHTTYTQREL